MRVRFNSKLVRLEGAYSAGSNRSLLSFQFQTGSIRSSSLESLLVRSFASFNSKLVRLEAKNSENDTVLSEVSIPNWFD